MPVTRRAGEPGRVPTYPPADRGDDSDGMVTAFLDAILHDLRQPVQIVRLLEGSAAGSPGGAAATATAERLSMVADVMEDSLATLADFNLAARTAAPDVTAFPVQAVLADLDRECRDFGRSYRRELRIVGSSAVVRSDAHILGRILRNLTSHMIRHAADPEILVGCRRRPGRLRVEVWAGRDPAPDADPPGERPLGGDWSHGAAADIGGPSAGLWAALRLGAVLADLVSIGMVAGGRRMALNVEVPIADAAGT